MSLLSRIGFGAVNAAISLYGTQPSVESLMHWQRAGISTHRDWLKILRGFYQQFQLYDARGYALYQEGIHTEALKNMRTCAYRAVEFYVATVWPGTLPDALPIESDSKSADAITEAIEQVWQWSDWERQKQVMVRHAATYGDSFVKVALRPDNSRVFFQLIDPSHVVDFDVDERGFLTWIRIDIPQSERGADGKVAAFTYTEVWERETTYAPVEANGEIRVVGTTGGRMRKWKHTRREDEDIARLGDPFEERPLSDFGIDFIPIDHCLFKDVGEQWGMGCFSHTTEKQMESDRQASRLAQTLFRSNRNTWFIESPGSIVDGRAANIPPPRVAGLNATTSDDGMVDVGGELLARLPGGWTAKSQVPQLQYDAALNILNAHLAELTHDLPELLYYDAAELGANASGRARRIHLTPAIDRALEARANLEASLIRLNQMALTMGKNARLFPDTIGTYENGDFAHRFKERDVLPADELEDAQALKAKYEGLVVKTEWLKAATDFELEADGYTAEDIARIKREREASAEEAMERELRALEAAPRLPANAEDDTEEGSAA
jgi:hypothetical protein